MEGNELTLEQKRAIAVASARLRLKEKPAAPQEPAVPGKPPAPPAGMASPSTGAAGPLASTPSGVGQTPDQRAQKAFDTAFSVVPKPLPPERQRPPQEPLSEAQPIGTLATEEQIAASPLAQQASVLQQVPKMNLDEQSRAEIELLPTQANPDGLDFINFDKMAAARGADGLSLTMPTDSRRDKVLNDYMNYLNVNKDTVGGRLGVEYIRSKQEAGEWSDKDAQALEMRAMEHQYNVLMARLGRLKKQQFDELGQPVREVDPEQLADVMAGLEYVRTKFANDFEQIRQLHPEAAAEAMEDRVATQTSDMLRAAKVPGAEAYYNIYKPVELSATRFIANLLKTPRTFSLNDEYDWTDTLAEFAEGTVRRSESEVPSAFQGPLVKDGKVAYEKVIPKTMETLSTMALLIGGGGGTNAGLVTNAFLQANGDYYQQAIDSGLKSGEAFAYAVPTAAGTSMLELVSPQKYVTDGVIAKIGQQAMKAMISGKSQKEAWRQGFSFVTKEIGEENAQELSQLFWDKMTAGAANLALGASNPEFQKRGLDSSVNLDEITETVLLTTIVAGLAAGGAKTVSNPLHQSSVDWAIQHPQEFAKVLETAQIPQDQKMAAAEKLRTYASAAKGIKGYEQMPVPARVDMVEAIAEKQRIKTQQKEAIVDETVSNIVGDKFDEELAAQDERIATAMGTSTEELAKRAEADRLTEQYDKAKLKSELTGTPMPEGLTKPKEVKIEPKLQEQPPAVEVEEELTPEEGEVATDEDLEGFFSELTPEQEERAMKEISSVAKSLGKKLGTQLKIFGEDEFVAAAKEAGAEADASLSEGFFVGKDNTIYINRKLLRQGLAAHEGTHAVVFTALAGNPKGRQIIASAASQALKASPQATAILVEFLKGYGGAKMKADGTIDVEATINDPVLANEVVAEFVAGIYNGSIKLDNSVKTFLRDLYNRVMAALGISTEFNPQTDSDFIAMAKQLASAMKAGRAISTRGSGGEAITQFSKVRDSAGRPILVDPKKAAALKRIWNNLTPEERKKLNRGTAEKLVDIVSSLPSASEMAAVAHAGSAKRGWYANSANAILHVFGKDAPRFAAALASTSPQVGVKANLTNTLLIWEEWVKRGRPTDRTSILSVMRDVLPKKPGGVHGSLETWENNTVRALSAEDPESIVLSGPKVNSFMMNLRGHVNEVTNDTWMANYALVDQTLFSGRLNSTGTNPGKVPGYLAMTAQVREAAKRLTKLTGETWTPAEVQETIWSWAKALYEMAKGEQRTAKQIIEDDALTNELINSTPDFRTLFHTKQNEDLLKRSGYAEEISSLRSRDDLGFAGSKVSGTEGKAGPFDSDTQKKYEKRAAARLDERRAQSLVTPGADGAIDESYVPFSKRAAKADFQPGRIRDLLDKSDWAIMTAENPMAEKLSAEDNSSRMKQFISDLDARGIEHIPVRGKYGNEENSVALIGVDEAKAMELGKKYQQESVLTNRGLVYQDGSVNPATGIRELDETPDDFYSVVNGQVFQIDIDFDTKIPAAQFSNRSRPVDFTVEKSSGDVKFFQSGSDWYFSTPDGFFKGIPEAGGVRVSAQEYDKKIIEAQRAQSSREGLVGDVATRSDSVVATDGGQAARAWMDKVTSADNSVMMKTTETASIKTLRDVADEFGLEVDPTKPIKTALMSAVRREINRRKRSDIQFSRRATKGNNVVPPYLRKELTDDGKGNYVFFHKGPAKLGGGKIDPAFFGTGKSKDRRSNAVMNFYTKPDHSERGITGDVTYAVPVPKWKVYPLTTDPLDLYDKAEEIFRKKFGKQQAFDAVRQADFIGPLAADAGFDMMIAGWSVFPLRAESTKALTPDMKMTERYAEESLIDLTTPEGYAKWVSGARKSVKTGKSVTDLTKMLVAAGYNTKTKAKAKLESLGKPDMVDAVMAEFDRIRQERAKPKPEVEPTKREATAPKEETKEAVEEREKEIRGTARRIRQQHPELGEALSDKGVFYDRLPNVISRSIADKLIEGFGIDAAKSEVMNPKSDISGAVRSMLFLSIMDRLVKDRGYAAAANLEEAYAEQLTNAGQQIQAMADIAGVFLTPEMAVFRAQKEVNKQRKAKQEKDKKHEPIKKGLRKVNEEVVEEVLTTVRVKSKITKASTPDAGTEPPPPPFGSKNKVFTKARKDAAWKAMMSRTASAVVVPEMVVVAGYYIEGGARSFAEVAAKVIKRGGKKMLPYLMGAYEQAAKELGVEPSSEAEINEFIAKANSDAAVDRVKKALRSNNRKEMDEAVSALQQISKDYDLWGLYREYAADKIKRMADREIAEDYASNDAMREFADGLVRNITAQMREEMEAKGVDQKEPKKRKSDIEIIGDAFRHFDRYEDAWKLTQNQFKAKLRAAEARLEKADTPDARREAQSAIDRETSKLEKLDSYFGDLMLNPFSEAGLGRAVRDGMKDLDQKIDNIIRQHYTVQEAAKRSLADKLVAEAGLSGAQATELANAVMDEFNRLATERKRRVIDQYISRKSATKEGRQSRKNLEDELLQLTNTGAFTDERFLEVYGKEMGWPSLTLENIAKIEELAHRVQEAPEGRPRFEAVEDLLAYQAGLKGVSKWEVAQAVWYANMLSGRQTQEVNFFANAMQIMAEASVAALRSGVKLRGRDMIGIAKALSYGFQRGFLEAGSTLATGYSPIRGKVDIPNVLERHKFSGLGKALSGLRYVRRVMVAADVLFFEAAKEMRAQQLAMQMARSENPDQNIRQRALEIMNRGDEVTQNARDQAQKEYEKEVADINKTRPAKEIPSALKKAERDRKRRVFELVERGRSEQIATESSQFAVRATYNHRPEGMLGAVAAGMNFFLNKAPAMRYVIPFVNIIANVANETANYSPVGFARAARGGPITGYMKPEMTESQLSNLKADLIAKGSIGTALMALAFILSEPGDDDDPMIEITGNGFGNWRQNKGLVDNAGWQPYSFKIRGTNKWISYQYSPLMAPLNLIGHYRDAIKYRGEKIDDGYLAMWAVAARRSGASFMDATMLGTLTDVLKSAGDETGENLEEALAKGAARMAKTFVIPSLYTQEARNIESMLDIPSKEVRNGALGYVFQDIPWVRNRNYDALNAFGDPIIPEGGFLPRFLEQAKTDPIAELINKHGWSPTTPAPKSLKVYDPELDDERVLTDEEQYRFFKIRGKYLKEAIMADIEALMAMDKKEFKEEVESMQAEATVTAKEELIPNL